ncbi:TolC family outer membrane protein [Thioalkalivibrio thiocyanodenitrificans]|uniref:TolC family outer membrane protein n=1 Tax=Thioalkalivibrio thiocyanodenitrificans TaxID=243063 RepID=UPI000364F67E|nr:TolC family outer membrane protein [Thioalkalivibrio thiocyanodenitrificans]
MTARLRTILFALVLLPAGMLPVAQSADLWSVYQVALDHDAELRAAEADYRAALEARPQARSVLLPQVEAGASQARTRTEPSGMPSSSFDTTTFDVTLNQSIYDHRNYVALRQADLGIAQATAFRDNARQGLILRVSEAYFDLLAAQDNLTFAEAEKEAIGRQLEQAERRFEVGLIAITDVKESQAQFDIAVAQEIAAMNQLDVAREQLAVVTGQHYEVLSGLRDDTPLATPEPDDINQWVATAVDSNLELTARRFATEFAAEEIQRQRAGHYPTVGLQASYSDVDNHGAPTGLGTTQFLDRRDARIALQLRVPLYTGGRTTSLTRESRERFDSARETLDLTQRRTVQQTRSAYLSVVSGASRVRALNRALESTQAAAEAAEAGFEVGTRTAVDVLLALREVFRAQRDYAQARYDFVLNTLRLKQAAGTLDERDIHAVNAWLH